MSKVAPVFRGKVDEGGRLLAAAPAKLRAYLTTLSGKDVLITIEEPSNRRSLAQNAYYWGVIVKLIADHTGHTSEEIHEFLKRKFLPVQAVEVAGERYEYVRSTTTLDTIEFEDYCEQCRAWAAQELSIVVPMPGEIIIGE